MIAECWPAKATLFFLFQSPSLHTLLNYCGPTQVQVILTIKSWVALGWGQLEICFEWKGLDESMKAKTYKLVVFIWTLHNNVVPLRTELAEINIMCCTDSVSLISRSWRDSVPSFALSTIFPISIIYYRAIWFESELWLRTEDLVPKSVKRMDILMASSWSVWATRVEGFLCDFRS